MDDLQRATPPLSNEGMMPSNYRRYPGQRSTGAPICILVFFSILLVPGLFSCSGHAEVGDNPIPLIHERQASQEQFEVAAPPSHAPPSEVGSGPDHTLLLDGAGRFANLVVDDSLYQTLHSVPIGREHAYMITGFLYQHFLDVFDFVIFSLDRPPSIEGQTAYWRNFQVRPAAEGLGLSFRDTSAEAGSEGRLGSVILLRSPADLVHGVSLHEIMHNWGQRILPTDYASHWGRSSVNGVMGGWEPGTLSQREGGYYATSYSRPGGPLMAFREGGGNPIPFADLELYMMGLLPPDSVGPITVAVGADYVPGQGSAFTASGFEIYGIDRIISEHGPRIPAYPEARTSFRAIFVVVSSSPLQAEEWNARSEDVKQFSMIGDDDNDRFLNFWEATGGRAMIRMDGLEMEVKSGTRSGGGVN